jgi:CheY-like chemotaxis protein
MAAKGNVTSQLVLGTIHGPWRSIIDSATTSNRDFERNGATEENPGQQVAKQIAKRIAIVDDEDDYLSMFSEVLRRLGYLVEFVAHDGSEIVNAVAEGRVHPDVILMDYRMPMMNGLEASRNVLNNLPNVKIVIISADDSIKQAAHAAGLRFLQKPCRTASIALLLKNL